MQKLGARTFQGGLDKVHEFVEESVHSLEQLVPTEEIFTALTVSELDSACLLSEMLVSSVLNRSGPEHTVARSRNPKP